MNQRERLRCGSGNGEKRLGLGSHHMRKASIYKGIQSTHSHGLLWENPRSN
jgi:hypothetical protein